MPSIENLLVSADFFFNPCSRLFSKPVAATSKRLETPSGFEFWVAKLFSLKFIGNGIETKKQIHAAYSGRIPLAFHLDIFLKESDAVFFVPSWF